MHYLRLSEGLNSYKLIPASDNLYDYIKDYNKDHYISIFKYNQEQFNHWKSTGSVAGLKNLTTNKLVFDFDSQNLEESRQDAITVSDRLKDAGINESAIQIAFTGSKGYSIQVDVTQELSQEEFKNITFKFAGDLNTFDRVVNDHQRIIRVVGTKHNKSGLYKFPLSVKQLKEYDGTTVKELAASFDNINESLINSAGTASLSDSVLALAKSPEKPEKAATDISFDESKKPRFLDLPRWYLQNGFFGAGERNNALLCMAATYKNLGFTEDHTYRLLKGIAEIQAKRNDVERYSDKEIWNNIVSVVYSNYWQGGQFSLKDENSWLYQYAKKYNIKITDEASYKPVVMSALGGDAFKSYAQSFYDTRIYTGLKDLDEAFPICAGSNVAIIGAASSGKCLGKDTPIRMFDGSVKMVQDVVVGDLLMGDDSLPRKVLSTCKGQENLYKINQASGMSYVINESHILSLKSNQNKSKKGKICKNSKYQKNIIIDINVLDYLNESMTFKRIFKGFHVSADYPKKEVHLDPYFLGLWLGDGSSSKINIHNPDKEIISYLKDMSINLGYSLNNHESNEEKCPSWSLTNKKHEKNIIKEGLKGYELLENKHIPSQFLINDKETRLKVLAGILDSDGYYDSSKNSYEVTFKSERLSNDLVILCRSLGLKVTKNSTRKGCMYKGEMKMGDYFRMYISGNSLENIPCLVERKKPKDLIRRTDATLTAIEIESLGYGDYYGFEIDGNHRFLLEDYTVTHNTALTLNILREANKQNMVSVFASLDMAKSRLYEKMLYAVTHGKKSREEIYQDYINGKGEQYDKLVQETFPNTYIFSKSAPTMLELKEYIESVQEHTGKSVRLLMIDYFERMGSEKSDDTQASKDVAGAIQDLISDFPELTPITLYQPNKFSLGGGPDKPILNYTAIKGSSFIYQSARQILSLWRPFFTPDLKHNDKFMEMAILKNDLGELGKFCYNWEGKTGNVSMMEDGDWVEYDECMKEKAEAERKQKQTEDTW